MGFKHNNGILECVTDEKYLRSAAGENLGLRNANVLGNDCQGGTNGLEKPNCA